MMSSASLLYVTQLLVIVRFPRPPLGVPMVFDKGRLDVDSANISTLLTGLL